jgi:transcriptional regulator with GAF, ATPase, and Fis domain
MKLTRGQADQIQNYDWPGNVRELKNVIERAVILSKGKTLRLDLSLPENAQSVSMPGDTGHSSNEEMVFTEKQMKSMQKKNILLALKASNWRVSGSHGAAELLDVKPTTLADRMKMFGIKKPTK